MHGFVDLLFDNDGAAGRATTSALVIVVALLVALGGSRLLARRLDGPYAKYYARKIVRYAVAFTTVVALAIVWKAFAGRVGVVLGLFAAGLAFAMQEVIGALAGWFNIMSGRVFSVGDRIEMAGVRGDVIDITPLRTKIIEIGSATDAHAWVNGRQYTGRIVAISNKKTFSDPVYNYSAVLDFIWEELALPIAYDQDWRRAEQLLQEEIDRIAGTAEAAHAMTEMARRYPVPRADVEARVFVRLTDNWVELAARFPVSVRTARRVKDDLSRRVLARMESEGISVASETEHLTVHLDHPAETPPT